MIPKRVKKISAIEELKQFVITQHCIANADTFVEHYIVEAKDESDARKIWFDFHANDPDGAFTYNRLADTFDTECDNTIRIYKVREVDDDAVVTLTPLLQRMRRH